MAEKEELKEGEKLTIYEVGYLISAQIGETELAPVVDLIRQAVDRAKAHVISEEFPRAKALAYTIKKSHQGKNEKHTSAYFGWIKFEADNSRIGGVKKELENIKGVVRFVLVKTLREAPVVPRPFFVRRRVESPAAEIKKVQKASGAPKPAISEADLDKTIEELIVE